MLQGKTVVLGITGSIAAYKMANVASMLAKQHCDVQVIMTKNATQFITPLTFETLCNTRCMVDTFDRNFQYNVEHVALAKRANLVMIAPASANIIAKMAHGIADDMLSTTVLACRCKKLVAPAMNTNMFENLSPKITSILCVIMDLASLNLLLACLPARCRCRKIAERGIAIQPYFTGNPVRKRPCWQEGAHHCGTYLRTS